MGLPEFKFTAYSGTSLENFKRLAFVSRGRIFYKKDETFPLKAVYYTPREAEAIYYARSYSLHPLVMCGRLPIYRWTSYFFYAIGVFPVTHVLLPDRDLPLKQFPNFELNGKYADYSQYFKPVNIHQILRE